ncbi:three-Cys-motif partner protein TcmP [Embleya sp. NBC_00888]|uniref:three-Cys-motif partner protein TcmP n=1 Tax=Embleya sp. NBC_00888 TaxID=2975960 RepID=UPI00386712A2|nr:three-Cys-motif partner protein TcmP [Embleya sp. NBC_00888]
MAVPTDVTWDLDQHTAAKHDIIRRYLQAWTPILLSRWPRVTYVDGFAGPGVYNGGEPGSPVVAFQVFSAALSSRPGKAVQMILMDEDSRRVDRLREEMGKALAVWAPAPSGQARVPLTSYYQGDCGAALLPALARDVISRNPIFALLDSFGGPNIPFSLVQRVANMPCGEVLVTFGTFLARFGKQPAHRESGDRMFGSSDWQAVNDQPANRKAGFLVNQYREALKRAGFKFTLSFEMVDEGGRPLHLIFGTGDTRGVEKMKEAMWAVDPVYGLRYRDQRDPSQCLLDLQMEPDTCGLRSLLLTRISASPRGITISELRDYTLLETVYKPTQVIRTVQAMRDNGHVLTEPRKIAAASIVRIAPVHAKPEQGLLFDVG